MPNTMSSEILIDDDDVIEEPPPPPAAAAAISFDELGNILKSKDFFSSEEESSPKSFILCANKTDQNHLQVYCVKMQNHLEKFAIFSAESDRGPVDVAILTFLKAQPFKNIQNDTASVNSIIVKSVINMEKLFEHCNGMYGIPKIVKPSPEMPTLLKPIENL